MNAIIKNYNSQIKKFQQIESDSSESKIHEKRVILRRIFPILTAFKMNPSKVRNGEKAFKLFGKLRDVQVQILKLGSIDQNPELIGYVSYLKKVESELIEKATKFSKKHKLEFPTIKKKSTLKKSKLVSKTENSLNKLIERIQSRSIDDAEDIHKIRIVFKKFRYKVDVLSHIMNIESSKLDMLKIYQDKLGEIQDYEVLINGIKKYCNKKYLDEEELIYQFEHDQDTLIVNFDNQIELFIAVCKDVLIIEPENSDKSLHTTTKSGFSEVETGGSTNVVSSTKDQVSEIVDSLITNAGKGIKKEDVKVTVENEPVEAAGEVDVKEQVSEINNTDSSKLN